MSQNSDFSDKRQFPRIPKQAAVEVTRLAFPLSSEPEVHGLGKDIGGGGICFFSSRPYEAGTMLKLNINIKGWSSHKKPHSRIMDVAGEEPLSAIAQVAWCRSSGNGEGYNVGVKFIDIYEDDFRALLKYLEA